MCTQAHPGTPRYTGVRPHLEREVHQGTPAYTGVRPHFEREESEMRTFTKDYNYKVALGTNSFAVALALSACIGLRFLESRPVAGAAVVRETAGTANQHSGHRP